MSTSIYLKWKNQETDPSLPAALLTFNNTKTRSPVQTRITRGSSIHIQIHIYGNKLHIGLFALLHHHGHHRFRLRPPPSAPRRRRFRRRQSHKQPHIVHRPSLWRRPRPPRWLALSSSQIIFRCFSLGFMWSDVRIHVLHNDNSG